MKTAEFETKNIVQNIMLLPQHLRAYLAEIIPESLDFEEDFFIGKERSNEITRRCNEIDQGKVDLIPGDEGFAQLRKVLA